MMKYLKRTTIASLGFILFAPTGYASEVTTGPGSCVCRISHNDFMQCVLPTAQKTWLEENEYFEGAVEGSTSSVDMDTYASACAKESVKVSRKHYLPGDGDIVILEWNTDSSGLNLSISSLSKLFARGDDMHSINSVPTPKAITKPKRLCMVEVTTPVNAECRDVQDQMQSILNDLGDKLEQIEIKQGFRDVTPPIPIQ